MANNIPTVFIIFGATGDLIGKKIVPALFHLFQKDKLPKMLRIIGFSRRDIVDEDFRKNVIKMLAKHHDLKDNKQEVDKFLKHFSYHQGNFKGLKSYENLAKILGRIDNEWKACSNKLFYLATPPQYNETIFKHLKASGLTIPCSPEEGWTRVIVEKPFGKDLETAEALDMLLGKLFKEEQIYRIDHYLAKDMLQNILSFRFSNNLLEDSWNNKLIEKIEIRLLERIGVEDRGQFYDGIGALRDVGQNHLLQMIALVTMDDPGSFEVEKVRNRRYEILQTLEIPNSKQIQEEMFKAQYKGYRDIKGVKPNSNTETYFKIKAYLTSLRWRGVPIILESGKRMKKQIKEIVVTFKHKTPCLCPPGKHFKNQVIFQLEPKEKIEISFLSKKPGLDMEIQERDFHFTYRKRSKKSQYVEEYEKLLLDCIEGNQLLFVSTSEIKAMWKYIDPIIQTWDQNRVPLHFYKPDTDISKQLDETQDYPERSRLDDKSNRIHKEIGIIGLGKMGSNLAKQLLEKGWSVIGFNRSPEDTKSLEKEGLVAAYDLQQFIQKLKSPRAILLSLPAGKAIDKILFSENGLIKRLQKGDFIIDFGNSFYKDSILRSKKLLLKGIYYTDVGISGGPAGARYGACLMVGGDRKTFDYLFPLFVDISVPEGVEFFEGVGAGHFVKMVHNGIEYGMMQAIAEGFAVLKKSKYLLDLTKVANIYNHGSVIESRLVGWLKNAFELHGDDLIDISGSVKHTGEGQWTVKTAIELELKAKIIEEALKFRIQSEKKPSYTGKILTALRNQFGGHDIK